MAHPPLHGIVPPIITPMNADESVNIPELRRQIEAKVTEFLGMHPQEFTPGEEDLDDGSAAMSDLD